MILNYTTKVPAARTIAEICELLGKKGAHEISQSYGAAGKVTAIRFSLPVAGVVTWFLLPANIEGVYGHMVRKAPPRYRNREQAERVTWRILKDWVEAQIALVESAQSDLAQVFLPYAMGEDGRTMYAHFLERNQKQLTAGGKPA